MILFGKCVFILLFTVSMATNCDITSCARDVTKAFRDTGTMCKKLPGIDSCFSNGLKSCTDDEKKDLQPLVDILNKLDNRCNGGEGLKANIGGLLVVAMMVVVRHFL